MFPKNIVQFLFICFLSLLLSVPFSYLVTAAKIKNQNLQMNILFVIGLSLFIGLIHLINYKRRFSLTYKIKPFNGQILLFLILIVWIIETILFIPFRLYFFSNNNHSPDVYLIFGALILGPVLEEIIFRNILLNSLLNCYSRNRAILISACLFALVHGNPIQISQALIPGLFFGLVYSKNKNIAYTIILHFFTNLFVFVWNYYLREFHNTSFFYLGIGLNVVISFLFLYYMKKKHGYSLLKLIKQT